MKFYKERWVTTLLDTEVNKTSTTDFNLHLLIEQRRHPIWTTPPWLRRWLMGAKDISPGYDESTRVPTLQNPSATLERCERVETATREK